MLYYIKTERTHVYYYKIAPKTPCIWKENTIFVKFYSQHSTFRSAKGFKINKKSNNKKQIRNYE